MNVVIRNSLGQPVELHLTGRTVVLPPYGSAEISVQESAEPYVRHMCETGRLSAGEKARDEANAPAGDAPPKRAAVKRPPVAKPE